MKGFFVCLTNFKLEGKFMLLDFKVNYHFCNFAEVKSPQNTNFFDSLSYKTYLLQENVFIITSVFKTEILKQIY